MYIYTYGNDCIPVEAVYCSYCLLLLSILLGISKMINLLVQEAESNKT